MKIKIRQFEIKNYRSCVNTKIQSETNLTVLVGVNGSGKSNILDGMRILSKIFQSSRVRYKYPYDHLSLLISKLLIDFVFEDKNYRLEAKIFYDITNNNNEDIYDTSLRIKEVNEYPSKWKILDMEAMLFSHRFKGDKRYADPEEMRAVARAIFEFATGITYYAATQFSQPANCPTTLEIDKTSSGVRASHRFRGNPHEKFMLDLYDTWENKPQEFKKYINVINDNGVCLVKDITFKKFSIPRTGLKVHSGRISETKETIDWIVPLINIDKLTLSPNQLSEGSFRTLALIYYLFNDNSSILLIEEPEVCIHHGLLLSIIELIKIQSKHKQIFLSTHSDLVLDQLSPENIVLVQKNAETGTSAVKLSKKLSRNNLLILKSYLKESGGLGEYWREGGFND